MTTTHPNSPVPASKPNVSGLRSLFKSVREQIPPVLRRADKARKAFTDDE